MEINNDNSCIPLHAHLKDEEEGIHKEQGCETYCKKQWKRWHWSYIPMFSTNQPLKVTMFGWYKTNTLPTWHASDIHLLPMHVTCVSGFARQFVQAPIVVVLTCIELYMQEDVIDYCATWYIWIWSWKHGTHVYRPMAYSRWFGLFHDNGDGGIQGEEGVMPLVKSPPQMRVSFRWMMLEDLMNQKVQMLQWK